MQGDLLKGYVRSSRFGLVCHPFREFFSLVLFGFVLLLMFFGKCLQ